ncbi:hypothetical protein ACO0QE_004057 [Hanseniaspora vineae]
MLSTKKRFEIENQVILITGGSQGLGLEFAKTFLRNTKKTKVIIVSRSLQKLTNACEKITSELTPLQNESKSKGFATLAKYKEGNSTRLYYHPCDLSSPSDVETNLQPLLLDIPVSQTFFVAGGTSPRLFKDHSLEELAQGVSMNYLSALYLSKVILSQISTCNHLVFFSSEVSFFPFVGYAQYAPLKTALKTLVCILRQEFPHKRLSLVYPGNFESEGYSEENLTKPEITKEIEGSSVPISCEECCDKIINSLRHGYDDITTDFIGWVLMSLDMGLNKNWNRSYLWGLQLILGVIANLIVVPIYMVFVNYQIRSWLKKAETKKRA